MTTPILRHERMSDIFSKWHIENLPIDAVIHEFLKEDLSDPHDHPWGFQSFVMFGGYIEKVYKQDCDGCWYAEIIERKPRTTHFVKATDIHQVIELPQGTCYTMILPDPWERVSGVWNFDQPVARFRTWDQPDFK